MIRYDAIVLPRVDGLAPERRPVPYAVFTDPQLGRIGVTEQEARANGRKLKIGRYPMSSVARALERDETRDSSA